jgi:2-polyprenyl-3-methyl-5-hydroxy-6-metoxy-1,4-benzoquinol methylase
MNSEDSRELQIIESWHCNAAPWGRAIREASIVSRQLVTNQAIIDAVASVSSSRILDIGCGEGWLARALSVRGMSVMGVDIVPELIAQAVASSGTAARDTAMLSRTRAIRPRA